MRNRDKLFHAIGRIVVEFQKTERSLTEFLAELLQAKQLNQKDIILGALSYGQKVDLMAALYQRRATPTKWKLCTLACHYLRAAEDFRNQTVHSDYHVISSNVGIKWIQKKASIRGGKGLRMRRMVVDIHRLVDAATVISELCVQATHFHFYSDQHAEEIAAKLQEGVTRLQKRPTIRRSNS
ncbi:MAG: hypothetical protein KIT44_12695 [Opitutaceae bacterium]|nr:hypothetical protein [Opitutaceae bacterium]